MFSRARRFWSRPTTSLRSGRLRHQIGKLSEEIGPVVLVDRDMLDVGKGNARFVQAIGYRLGWETGPVLHAAKPFLFRGGDKLTVAN